MECKECGGTRFKSWPSPTDQRERDALVCEDCLLPVYGARRSGKTTKGKARGTARIKSAADVAPALAEVMTVAERDDVLQPGDLAILEVMQERAAELASIEIAATREWLRSETGLGIHAVRNGFGRLKRFGYLRQISMDEVTRDALRAWLARRYATGSVPTLVRLADRPPRHGQPAPRPGRPRVHADDAARQRAHRARKRGDVTQ